MVIITYLIFKKGVGMNKKRQSFLSLLVVIVSSVIYANQSDFVTIAILAKDKAHTLPLYLRCIEHQTWPKAKTYLYIRTNNNNDNTAEILKAWLARVGDLYAEIYFDDTDLQEQVQKFGQHEWNGMRFKVLGKIRQDSIVWAYVQNSHYFVVDCDNFIHPNTLESLMKLKLPIVAPFMVRQGSYYSNFHAAIDKNGYLEESPLSEMIYDQVLKELFRFPSCIVVIYSV